jgi:hypothetical protein
MHQGTTALAKQAFLRHGFPIEFARRSSTSDVLPQVGLDGTSENEYIYCTKCDQRHHSTFNGQCNEEPARFTRFQRLLSVSSCLKITHCETYSGRILRINAKFSISHEFFR